MILSSQTKDLFQTIDSTVIYKQLIVVMFCEERQAAVRPENPYGVMDKVEDNDESSFRALQIHLREQEHEYSTLKPNNQATIQVAQSDSINQFFDERYFPHQQSEKVDSKSAATGKMVGSMGEPYSPFSFSSSIKIDPKDIEDHQDSTMTSKKMANNLIELEEDSRMDSFQLSQESRGSKTGKSKVTPPKSIRGEVGNGKVKLIQKKKKDERKNVCNNCFKFIVKEFLSPKYRQSVAQICDANGVDRETVCSFYQEKLSWSISLSILRSLLNFKEPSIDDELRRIKLTFHKFFVFYMRNRYNHHILTEKKIEHKDEYLEAKRYLMNLPDIKPLPKFHRHLSQS